MKELFCLVFIAWLCLWESRCRFWWYSVRSSIGFGDALCKRTLLCLRTKFFFCAFTEYWCRLICLIFIVAIHCGWIFCYLIVLRYLKIILLGHWLARDFSNLIQEGMEQIVFAEMVWKSFNGQQPAWVNKCSTYGHGSYSIAVSKIYIVLNEKWACTKNLGKYDLPPGGKETATSYQETQKYFEITV